jgi:hypothetical protein
VTAPTVFLHQGRWKMSERTNSGFRHTDLGPVTGIATTDAAVERALELLRRRAAVAA